MCRLIRFGVALLCVCVVGGNASAQVQLLWEDFDGLALTDSVDEGGKSKRTEKDSGEVFGTD